MDWQVDVCICVCICFQVLRQRGVVPIPVKMKENDQGGGVVQRLGGWGCHKFVPVLGGDGTKIAPAGDLFDQPLGDMS